MSTNKLIIEGREYADPTFHDDGGEGEVFTLGNGEAAKVYWPDQRTQQRRQKVLALCDANANFRQRHTSGRIAFPRAPAYSGDTSFESLVGFSMPFFNCPTLNTLSFDLASKKFSETNGYRLDDGRALTLVYELFSLIEQLHETRVIVGDINPRNIFVDPDTDLPGLWDIDSAQVGNLPSFATHPYYGDPAVTSQGVDIVGAYTFDCGADVYSLSTVAFELLVGVRPHFLHVAPATIELENKANGIGSLSYLVRGPKSLDGKGVTYVACPANSAIADRLAQIKVLDPKIFDHFVRVFLKGDRESLLFSLPISDPRNPSHRFVSSKSVRRMAAPELKRVRDDVRDRQGLFQEAGFHDVITSISAASVAGALEHQPDAGNADPQAFFQFIGKFGLAIT